MLKTLASQIKEYKKASIATPVFMILEVIMETIIPLMMASIIDDGVNKGDMKHIYVVGAGMLVIAAIGLFAGIMGGVYGAKASAGFARNLRKGMYDNIQTFSFSNIDKFSTASLVTRLTTDVTNIQNAYQMVLRMCMRAPASLICALELTCELDEEQKDSNGIYYKCKNFNNFLRRYRCSWYCFVFYCQQSKKIFYRGISKVR